MGKENSLTRREHQEKNKPRIFMFSSNLFLAATASTTATCNTLDDIEARLYHLHTLSATIPKIRTARNKIIISAIVCAITSFWEGGSYYFDHIISAIVYAITNLWVGGRCYFDHIISAIVYAITNFWVGGRCYFVHFAESVKNKTVSRKSVCHSAGQLRKSTLKLEES